MGWVETLPSGRFRAIAWNAITNKRETVPGPQRRGRTWGSWTEADAAWRGRENEIDGIYTAAGVDVERQQCRRMTFAEYAEAWARVQSGELNTRTSIRSAVTRLTRHFGDHPIDEITSMDVRAFFADRQKERFAAATRQAWLIWFRQIMTAAVEDHLRETNPLTGIKVERAAPGEARILTDDEFLLVLSYMPERFRPAPLLAYDCGLRAAEIGGLRWMRFDLESGDPSLLITDVIERDKTLRGYPKGKNPERLPLTERTVTALQTLRANYPGGPSDYVFRSNRGNVVTGQYLSQVWRRARIKAGVNDPPVHFHHLRHACATNLARAGAPAPVIQATLRHGDLATSQRYIEKVSLDQQRVWMRRVGQPIAPVRELRPTTDVSDQRDSDEHAS